jgi:hypothetical protein
MTSRIWFESKVVPGASRMIRRLALPIIVAFGFFMGSAGAMAQTVGPDEAFDAHGSIAQILAQKSAIYSAVLQQRSRAALSANSLAIPMAVGASVPPSADLSELPEQTAVEPWATVLKYAMVEDDIVLVDPTRMRVVDVIYGSARSRY